MVDNAYSYDKIGKTILITYSRSCNSGKVELAKSHRITDWYFIDFASIKSVDTITIHGWTSEKGKVFTIGALTFDLFQ